MIGRLAYAFNAVFKSRVALIAENLCLRQQLLLLKRHQFRPRLQHAYRCFWNLDYRRHG